MRYIRTKDGIYELNPPDYEGPMCLDGKTITTCVYTKNQEWVAKSDILKQSDNLEELCDEYVMENKDHTYQTLLLKTNDDKRSFYNNFVEDIKNGWLSYCYEYLQKGWEIYGAIIVRGAHGEPILRPVAKMKIDGGWALL